MHASTNPNPASRPTRPKLPSFPPINNQPRQPSGADLGAGHRTDLLLARQKADFDPIILQATGMNYDL